MTFNYRNFLNTIFICLLFAGIGIILSGDFAGWFAGLNHPWYSLPIFVWNIVEILFYLIIAVILYRLFNKKEESFPKKAIIALTIAVIIYNEIWNYVLVGAENMMIGFIGLVPYLGMVGLLYYNFLKHDRVNAWILTPYLIWLVYDVILTFGLWTLNS
ncbi:MAG: TspO/MBR family protein [Candidatus Cyclobacteriaceae bacterium M3_2C_046]